MIEMIPVQSSNVAAVGYIAEIFFLRVQFKNGEFYDFPNTPAISHQHLMAANSKGKWIAQNLTGGTKLTCHVDSTSHETPSEQAAKKLETIQDDSCCQKIISMASREGIDVWWCPRCGQEWRCKIVEGCRHWAPHEVIMVW